jgi:hypothetical protein
VSLCLSEEVVDRKYMLSAFKIVVPGLSVAVDLLHQEFVRHKEEIISCLLGRENLGSFLIRALGRIKLKLDSFLEIDAVGSQILDQHENLFSELYWVVDITKNKYKFVQLFTQKRLGTFITFKS